MKNSFITFIRFAVFAIVSQPFIVESAETNSSTDSSTSFGTGASEPVSPNEWYGAGVRPTEKRSPEEERSGFHLPPGFEINLVASEPEIAKPLNMAFGAKGKLWLTQTIEYPYPRTDGKPAGDCVKVLEDTDGNGSFDRVTTFADGLNIPIGILPFEDGAIVFSIPNLIHLRDTDGDGHCDQRDIILGPFDTTRDTHGMVNSLRQGDDGWIYACHGFNNHSVVKGSDGHVVTMTSGNTFRFRPDGSRVELYTSGQVNPFGMTVDRWGNRYTADCHSKPITSLVQGACYPSFGRTDDGLGFFPSMMSHLHGSTAISGLCFYDAPQFPAAYRGQLFSGNVMTSRINRDQIQQTGATVIAHEVTDFLTSDDPWFRPVDIQLGPDGALYIADFYNRIIGHYEVPLDHPGRDRDSGRIWKICYTSSDTTLSPAGAAPAGATPAGVTPAGTVESYFEQLIDPNATRRQLALNALTIFDRTYQTKIISLAKNRVTHENSLMRIGAMWLLHRCDSLSMEALSELIQDPDALVRHHALCALTEVNLELNGDASAKLLSLVNARLVDDNPSVVGSAAQALAKHGDSADAAPLVARIMSVPATDLMLTARLRIALRDLILRKPDCLKQLRNQQTSQPAKDIYCDVLLGIPSSFAASVIIDELERRDPSQPISLTWIQHAARNANDLDLSRLVTLLRKHHSGSVSESRKMLSQLKESLASRTSPEITLWAESIVEESLRQVSVSARAHVLPVVWRAESGADWALENRQASDADNEHRYRSSLTLGEKYTGVLCSSDLIAPNELSFWIVGHNGSPGESDARLNRIRLVDVTSGALIYEAFPPRSDVATKVVWDLKQYAGRPIRLEVVDAHTGDAYAWIAVGRFSDERLNPAGMSDEWASTLDLISQYRLTSQALPLLQLARDPLWDVNRRLQAAERWAELRDDPATRTTAWFLARFPHDAALATRFFALLNDTLLDRPQSQSEFYRSILHDGAKTLTQANQRELARRLASSRELAPWLVESMEDGWLAPSLLRDKAIETSLESTLGEPFADRLASLKLLIANDSNDLVELRANVLRQSASELGDLSRGTEVFQKHCAICHQLGGQGSLVGPQLDGIGARGAERLLEDILLPDRNVDKAFRTTSLLLDSGTVRVGLIRSENESTIELIENNGKSIQIDVSSVTSRRASNRSLMPDGHSETIGVSGLVDLLRYIQVAAAAKKIP